MKKLSIKLAIALAALMSIVACDTSGDDAKAKSESYKKDFLDQTEISASVKGKVVKTYNEENDQTVYNDFRTMFTLTNLDYSSQFTVKITGGLLKLDNVLDVTYESAGVDGLTTGEAKMTLVKADYTDERYWLWDNSTSTGFVIDFSF